MTDCLFASDLHGHSRRYEALFAALFELRPLALFLGGDLLPFPLRRRPGVPDVDDFVRDYLAPHLEALRAGLGDRYPKIFVIPGNDDPRIAAEAFLALESSGLWTWAHDRLVSFGRYVVLGSGYVPPTPFLLKDWERYDVGPHIPPGSLSPEEGYHSVPVDERTLRYVTIAGELDRLAGSQNMNAAVLLTHSPPYRTHLDRAALDGKVVDHAPVDVHIGSVAVRRFIESRAPLLSLHGHVHESARLTGTWRDRIGTTHCFGAAHDGPELALIRFDPERLEDATRELR